MIVKESVLDIASVKDRLKDLIGRGVIDQYIDGIVDRLYNQFTRIYNQLSFDVSLGLGEIRRQLMLNIPSLIHQTVNDLYSKILEVVGKPVPSVVPQARNILESWLTSEVNKRLGELDRKLRYRRQVRSKWLLSTEFLKVATFDKAKAKRALEYLTGADDIIDESKRKELDNILQGIIDDVEKEFDHAFDITQFKVSMYGTGKYEEFFDTMFSFIDEISDKVIETLQQYSLTDVDKQSLQGILKEWVKDEFGRRTGLPPKGYLEPAEETSSLKAPGLPELPKGEKEEEFRELTEKFTD